MDPFIFEIRAGFNQPFDALGDRSPHDFKAANGAQAGSWDTEIVALSLW